MITYRKKMVPGLLLASAGAALALVADAPAARGASAVLLAAAALLIGLSTWRLHRTRHERSFFKNLLLVYGPYIAVALLLAVALRVALILAPAGHVVLVDMSPAALERQLAADEARLAALNAGLPGRLAALALAADAPASAAPDTRASAAPDAPAALVPAWTRLLEDTAAYRELLDTYKGFHRIDYLTRPESHTRAFLLGLWACVRLQTLASALSVFLERHPALRKELDAAQPGFGAQNATAMIRAMASDTTLLRIHAGAAYLALLSRNAPSSLRPELDRLAAALAAVQRESGRDTLRAIADPLKQLAELDRVSAPTAGPTGKRGK
jgi:hypothetical protein